MLFMKVVVLLMKLVTENQLLWQDVNDINKEVIQRNKRSANFSDDKKIQPDIET